MFHILSVIGIQIIPKQRTSVHFLLNRTFLPDNVFFLLRFLFLSLLPVCHEKSLLQFPVHFFQIHPRPCFRILFLLQNSRKTGLLFQKLFNLTSKFRLCLPAESKPGFCFHHRINAGLQSIPVFKRGPGIRRSVSLPFSDLDLFLEKLKLVPGIFLRLCHNLQNRSQLRKGNPRRHPAPLPHQGLRIFYGNF